MIIYFILLLDITTVTGSALMAYVVPHDAQCMDKDLGQQRALRVEASSHAMHSAALVAPDAQGIDEDLGQQQNL